MNDPSRTSEIIGIRNDAIHEPIPGHQINILWQNAFSDLYIFDHWWVDISLGSMLKCFTRRSKAVDHCEIWSFVKCGFLPSSCISQLVIIEIRRSFTNGANWEWKIYSFTWVRSQTWTWVNCCQYMPLNVVHDWWWYTDIK